MPVKVTTTCSICSVAGQSGAAYEMRAGIDNLLDKDPGVFGATRVLNTDGSVNTALSNNALGSSVVWRRIPSGAGSLRR